MEESIKFFVGLDAHKDSIAVAVCEAGRGPSRFVGTLGPDVQGVLKTLRKYGPAQQVSVVHEAGPTGDGLHRELSRRGYRLRDHRAILDTATRGRTHQDRPARLRPVG